MSIGNDIYVVLQIEIDFALKDICDVDFKKEWLKLAPKIISIAKEKKALATYLKDYGKYLMKLVFNTETLSVFLYLPHIIKFLFFISVLIIHTIFQKLHQ